MCSSLFLLVLGVILATTGEYRSSKLGFALTLSGAFLASVKTIATNRLQTAGMRFSALELVFYMNVLACLEAAFVARLGGELRAAGGDMGVGGRHGDLSKSAAWDVCVNVGLAFGLNVASYATNRLVGALTMSVGGNVKQVLAVALATVMRGAGVGWAFVLGMFSLCSTRTLI